ncbi:DUF3105 domain-containing protein [Marinitenerispora sediminis]|uniref:DUF3105 domain-containing protein n=1 Tax=Marinitenerispora sediminis TaxID=1931232 RepID=A0A368TBK8_9ACTN|nr:DUF3105 domain-containing protein [Marinitenerispora sediminis]RCV54035.1 hypothetical protein DEF28_09165 [Marinitenerispora sediminis]RCV60814.1 hypothetical protein DEF23_03735 [Marinitenerispora sediminis]RCV62445.1 hypothetical protein DEF24_01145 [Marinitenerispora sediminis]
MGKKAAESAAQRRRKKAEERRAQRIREERRRKALRTAGISALAVLLVGGVAFAGFMEYRRRHIEGLLEYDGLTNTHVAEDVDYEQSPPVGGDHHEAWQNCGVYTEPLRDVHAVHSLEHGAVWITYGPDLPADEVEQLNAFYTPGSYVLVSPYEGDMPGPIVASAWGRQVAVDSTADERLGKFLRLYEQHPDVPEPGALCSGAIDMTAAELEAGTGGPAEEGEPAAQGD